MTRQNISNIPCWVQIQAGRFPCWVQIIQTGQFLPQLMLLSLRIISTMVLSLISMIYFRHMSSRAEKYSRKICVIVFVIVTTWTWSQRRTSQRRTSQRRTVKSFAHCVKTVDPAISVLFHLSHSIWLLVTVSFTPFRMYFLILSCCKRNIRNVNGSTFEVVGSIYV